MGNVLGAIGLVIGLLVAPIVDTAPVIRPTKKEALLVGDSVMSILLHTDAALTLLEKEHRLTPVDVRRICGGVARALARPDDRILVLGSFHTVGPALEWLGV